MKKTILLSLLLAFGVQFTSHAQWLEKKGNGYFKLGVWSLIADKHYTDTGEIDPNATRGNFNVSLYTKFGLSKNWNAIVYIPFYVKSYQNRQLSTVTNNELQKGEEFSSIGDMNIGVEYRLFKKSKHAFSTVLTLGIPSGNSQGGSDGSYQTGDGEFNQQIRFNAGTTFKIHKQAFYSKGSFGFNNRTEGFSDELRAGVELGSGFFNKKLFIILRSNIVKSLKNGSLNATTSNGSLFANNVEFTGIGGEISWKFTNVGVSLGYQTAVSAKLIYAAPSYSAGIFYLLR